MKKRKAGVGACPVVSLGAEYLVMGHLMRRNILTFKAPKATAGYDLICRHPEKPRKGRQVRVQVKSRLATRVAGEFPVQAETLALFDYLIVAHLNIGLREARAGRAVPRDGARAPEFYTFPMAFLREHLQTAGVQAIVRVEGLELAPYTNEAGFEQIAGALGIAYPSLSG